MYGFNPPYLGIQNNLSESRVSNHIRSVTVHAQSSVLRRNYPTVVLDLTFGKFAPLLLKIKMEWSLESLISAMISTCFGGMSATQQPSNNGGHFEN